MALPPAQPDALPRRHCGAHALELAKLRGMTFVHPFDDLDVIAGQGTVALEMLRAVPVVKKSNVDLAHLM
jgi:threonine dehydratase